MTITHVFASILFDDEEVDDEDKNNEIVETDANHQVNDEMTTALQLES